MQTARGAIMFRNFCMENDFPEEACGARV